MIDTLMFLLSSNGCIHHARYQVDKLQLDSSMTKKRLNCA